MSRFTRTLTSVASKIGGFVKGSSTKVYTLKDEATADSMANILRKVSKADVEQVGNRVVLNTDGLTANAKRTISEVKRAYKADMVVDGGSVSLGGVSWKKVLFVVGGAIVVVMLIDPSTGTAIGKTVADVGTNLLQPFIPSILSVLIPCVILVSSGMSAFGVMQRM